MCIVNSQYSLYHFSLLLSEYYLITQWKAMNKYVTTEKQGQFGCVYEVVGFTDLLFHFQTLKILQTAYVFCFDQNSKELVIKITKCTFLPEVPCPSASPAAGFHLGALRPSLRN